MIQPRTAFSEKVRVLRVLGRGVHHVDANRGVLVDHRVFGTAMPLDGIAQVDHAGQPCSAGRVPTIIGQPLGRSRTPHSAESGVSAVQKK